jgi:hypothetical protein
VATNGWIAEQTSWRKPGSVSSALRVPPPIASLASRTRTDRPAWASVTAAASPLGPAPRTTASSFRLRVCSDETEDARANFPPLEPASGGRARGRAR